MVQIRARVNGKTYEFLKSDLDVAIIKNSLINYCNFTLLMKLLKGIKSNKEQITIMF